MSKQVSIVIPAKNAVATLDRTLASLTYDREFIYEILIIDDDSTDQTHLLASQLGRLYNLPVKVMQLRLNSAGAARNAGLRNATGDLLFFIDADDELIPGGLRQLYECARSNPKAGVVIGGYVRRTPGSPEKAKKPRPFGTDKLQNANDYLTNRQRSIAMGSALIRRSAVVDAVFPENVAFDEDTFFWAKILSRELIQILNSLILIYNADAARMERRFTSAKRCDLQRMFIELDNLAIYGISPEAISWRKTWLGMRVARSLIRAGEYGDAADCLYFATAQNKNMHLKLKGQWYRIKIYLLSNFGK